MTDCIFCQIATGAAPATRVYEDDHVVAFMDIFPMAEGHCLIATKAHAENIFDLPEEPAVAVMKAALKIAPAVMQAMEADGLNILQSNGRAAWQSVDHFHMHLIPRYADDGVSPPFRAHPAKPSEIQAQSQSIKDAL